MGSNTLKILPGAKYRDWLALLKPRVVALVAFSGMAGLMVAPGHLDPLLACIAVLCISTAAGGCGAINMWYDGDIDAIMGRTRNRPIPMGKITADAALEFGVLLIFASTLVMGLVLNWTAASLLLIAITFYVVIYTIWLKRRTCQNIVIGGAAGAFPPVIGWASVTGTVELVPLVLFGIIFFWTPPHFWSLSLWFSKDYDQAGIPMLPAVMGSKRTRQQIVVYTLLLVAVAYLPVSLDFGGPMYSATSSLIGIIYLEKAYLVAADAQDFNGVSLMGDKEARSAFKYSIVYLFTLFTALVIDRLIR